MCVFFIWMRDCVIFIKHLLNYKFCPKTESTFWLHTISQSAFVTKMELTINIIIINSTLYKHQPHIYTKHARPTLQFHFSPPIFSSLFVFCSRVCVCVWSFIPIYRTIVRAAVNCVIVHYVCLCWKCSNIKFLTQISNEKHHSLLQIFSKCHFQSIKMKTMSKNCGHQRSIEMSSMF